jgi:hypothetical protein
VDFASGSGRWNNLGYWEASRHLFVRHACKNTIHFRGSPASSARQQLQQKLKTLCQTSGSSILPFLRDWNVQDPY